MCKINILCAYILNLIHQIFIIILMWICYVKLNQGVGDVCFLSDGNSKSNQGVGDVCFLSDGNCNSSNLHYTINHRLNAIRS